MTTLETRLARLEGKRRPDDCEPPAPFNMGHLWLHMIGRSKARLAARRWMAMPAPAATVAAPAAFGRVARP